MDILTEYNYDCSFMQTIIRLPQTRDDLKAADINASTIERLSFYIDFTDNILTEFVEYPNIANLILKCKQQNEIYYVKTFPDKKHYASDKIQEYLCYGEYHRNLSHQYKNIFFRLDQNWDTFRFPQFEQSKINEAFKKNVQLLSGTVIETTFPPIYLEQSRLNNKSDLLRHHFLDRLLLDSLYLFSTDYYGNSVFLDSKGNLFEFINKKGTLFQSDNDLFSWTDNKLKNIFELQLDH